MNTNLLYAAQTASQNAVYSHWLPRYNPEHNNFLWNLPHDFCTASSAVALFTLDVVKGIAYIAFQVISIIFEQILLLGDFKFSLIDTFCPLNPIDGKRHYTIVPRPIEKAIGDLVFCISGLSWHILKDITTDDGTSMPVQEFTNQLLQKLEQTNKDLVNPTGLFTYEATVVADIALNAFALPGGRIVVFEHILSQIQESFKEKNQIKDTTIRLGDGSSVTVDLTGVTFESVIAALLAHEMTHSASRHGVFSITLDLILETLVAILPPALEDLMREAFFLIPLYRSRSNEYEADITGAFLATQAQYDPRGALYLQEFFKSVSSDLLLKFNEIIEPISTHPCTNSRLAALFAGIAAFAPDMLKNHIIEWKGQNSLDIAKIDNHIEETYDQTALSPEISTARKLRTDFPETQTLSERKHKITPKDSFSLRQLGRNYLPLDWRTDSTIPV